VARTAMIAADDGGEDGIGTRMSDTSGPALVAKGTPLGAGLCAFPWLFVVSVNRS